MKANIEIRTRLKETNIPQWRLAEQLGQSEGTFCRKMRHELSEEEKQQVLRVLEELYKQQEVE